MACLRSWSLKLGFLGPISVMVVVGFGVGGWWDLGVRGSFSAAGSSGAPVSFCTTARKFDGSAWTKVVLGEVGSAA